jgi:hypothetical protein
MYDHIISTSQSLLDLGKITLCKLVLLVIILLLLVTILYKIW